LDYLLGVGGSSREQRAQRGSSSQDLDRDAFFIRGGGQTDRSRPLSYENDRSETHFACHHFVRARLKIFARIALVAPNGFDSSTARIPSSNRRLQIIEWNGEWCVKGLVF
jgi:hypothetical protein